LYDRADVDKESLIAPDVLGRYAADAACAVDGVAGLFDGKPVRVTGDEDTLAVAFALELEWGRNAADVAREVQKRVSDYLAEMANVTPASVDVVFHSVTAPPPKR
jgi:uncharacterized alkaline shock family protein YloU